jgi:hypothetical protein
MSTLQCANIHFESTQNNRVQYLGSNNFAFVAGGSNLMVISTSGSTLNSGFTVTPYNLGVITTALTANGALGNYQYMTANAAFTLTAPTSDTAIDILVTNGTGAGTITFSGFTAPSGGGGDTYATTSSNRYLLMIRRINSIATYAWKALQ